MSFDWIRNPDLPATPWCQYLRKHDWKSTALGPMEQWPPLLCQYALQIMLNPEPRIICWGDELALVYNEAALPLVSVMGKHPDQLGQPTFVYWEELVEQGARDMVDQVMIQGQAIVLQNHYFALQRPAVGARTSSATSNSVQAQGLHSSCSREGYYTMKLLPIFDANACIAGVLYEGNETTAHVVAARRLATLLSIENRSHEVTTLKDIWRHVLDGLDQNVQDIPFAFLYSGTGDPNAASLAQLLSLEGAIGLPIDHPVAKLNTSDTSLPYWIEKVCDSGKPMVVDCAELRWYSGGQHSRRSPLELNVFSDAAHLEPFHPRDSDDPFASHSSLRISQSEAIATNNPAFDHKPFIIPGRGFGDEVRSALILPIPRRSGPEPMAVLVMGINPQQTYNEPYQEWTSQLTESLVRVIASISVSEELSEHQRAIQEMSKEHARASSYLKQGKKDAERAEELLKRMAESAPVGMAMFKADGTPTWVNQGYADHLNLRKEDCTFKNIKSNLHPDDAFIVDRAQEDLALPLEELRVHREEHDVNMDPILDENGKYYSYIMAAPSSLYDDAGEIECIFGWTLDITHKKKAERLQAQRLKDQAERIQDILEAKRQSENFIDMTSHEMRNPLSAIIQSAEFIISSIGGLDNIKVDADHRAIMESAEVINLCAQHQKRIVDDLLTISKLDAKLLLISREKVDPIIILQKMLQMYEGELKNAGIETELVVDQSLNDMAIDRVELDPSRLLQVLINIFTNAMKFTRNSRRRKITLKLSSSYSRPACGPQGGFYVPFRPRTPGSLSSDGEQAPGESPRSTVFLQFSVEDSGRGLSADEMGVLFQRFSQASPRTYGKYGGSGLGLFISRELLELQGGQIGVQSVLGEGTTFFFYVECKRHNPNPERINERRRRSSDFDVAEEVKRHKSDDLLVGDDAWSARLDSAPGSPTECSDTEKHSNLKLLPMSSPLCETPSHRESGVIHVLIVEDNKINQKVLSQQLKRKGCITHTADHGGQAIDFLLASTLATLAPRQYFPDMQERTECSCVLLDVEMPVMDGLTAVRRIRELELEGKLRKHIPIIAITANARAKQRVKALEAGMNSVMTKPFSIPDVMEKMRYWIAETDARLMGG